MKLTLVGITLPLVFANILLARGLHHLRLCALARTINNVNKRWIVWARGILQ